MFLKIMTGLHRLANANFSTCCKFACLPERFDLALFCLQDILTSQNVRSKRTRSEFFRKEDDYLHINS